MKINLIIIILLIFISYLGCVNDSNLKKKDNNLKTIEKAQSFKKNNEESIIFHGLTKTYNQTQVKCEDDNNPKAFTLGNKVERDVCYHDLFQIKDRECVVEIQFEKTKYSDELFYIFNKTKDLDSIDMSQAYSSKSQHSISEQAKYYLHVFNKDNKSMLKKNIKSYSVKVVYKIVFRSIQEPQKSDILLCLDITPLISIIVSFTPKNNSHITIPNDDPNFELNLFTLKPYAVKKRGAVRKYETTQNKDKFNQFKVKAGRTYFLRIDNTVEVKTIKNIHIKFLDT